MYFVAEVSICPMDGSDSLPLIIKCLDVFDDMKIVYKVHAMGTNLEGSHSDILKAVQKCIEAVDCKKYTLNVVISCQESEDSISHRLLKL